MAVKISKKVPLPPVKARSPKYPWEDMAVGDSFRTQIGSWPAARAQASNAGRRYGKRFTARKLKGELRIWRVS